MKYYISNLYGVSKDISEYKNMNNMAQTAHSLGFYELGLYRYPTDVDSDDELSKRLDGIIAGIEKGDVVFLQFPSDNGEVYDNKLLSKCVAYGAKVILLVHKINNNENIAFYNYADRIIADDYLISSDLLRYGINNEKLRIASFDANKDDISIKALLIEELSLFSNAIHMEELAEKYRDSDEYIHVCFGLQDRTGVYSSYVGATMASVSENTQNKIFFHILHDDSVSEDNKNKLGIVANKYGNIVEFHQVDSKEVMTNNSWIRIYSLGSLFRLFIPKLFPKLKKMIYLDADLLFMKDISELWNLDLTGYGLAAVPDEGEKQGIGIYLVSDGVVPSGQYFNSGLLVMNLDYIREMGELTEMVMNFIHTNPQTTMPDQDGLNAIFVHKTYLLDASWNVFESYERFRTDKLEDKVYHYAGQPFVTCSHIADYDKKYISIREDLPWGADLVINDFYRSMWSAYSHVRALQEVVRKGVNQKKKIIFWGYYASGMISILDILKYDEDAYFLQTDDNDNASERCGLKVYPFEKLHEEEKGTYMLFTLPDAYNGHALERLQSIGLVEGEDFFVIPMLLTEMQGGYI